MVGAFGAKAVCGLELFREFAHIECRWNGRQLVNDHLRFSPFNRHRDRRGVESVNDHCLRAGRTKASGLLRRTGGSYNGMTCLNQKWNQSFPDGPSCTR
jgi:hypothetical protein